MSNAMFFSRQLALRHVLTFLAFLFIALALVGGWRGYSPVPFWDMWGSYLGFIDHSASDDWSPWFAQHNEHRIVLARLFFWADVHLFKGAGLFLIVANYLLVAFAALLYCQILREATAPSKRTTEFHALSLLVVCALFFWSQQESLIWGFQSQFFLAQSLPLAALYMLYRSRQGGLGGFVLACLLGILSAGTMANGVLALPLMVAYALLTRQGALRSGTLAALAALVLFAYFRDYVPPSEHGSLLLALGSPLKFASYVVYFLGSPFYFAFGTKALGRLAALLGGIFLLVSSLRFAWQLVRNRRHADLQLVLLAYIAYIVGSAIGTAGGRLVFGVSQALTERYTTSALMAWAALLVLYAPTLLALQEPRRRRVWGGLAVLALLMLAYQFKALHSKSDELFDRSVAALAIELRIKDLAEIRHVGPSTNVVDFTVQASDKQRSIFGLYPYRDARAHMGTSFAPIALPDCRGAMLSSETVEGDERYLRVRGWLYEPIGDAMPQVIRMLAVDGKQVGYALGGAAWSEAAAAQQKAPRRSGFRGYLASDQAGTTITLRGEEPNGPICQLKVTVPYTQH